MRPSNGTEQGRGRREADVPQGIAKIADGVVNELSELTDGLPHIGLWLNSLAYGDPIRPPSEHVFFCVARCKLPSRMNIQLLKGSMIESSVTIK